MAKQSIVIGAENWVGSTTYGMAQGFRKLGWEVYELSPSAFMPIIDSRALRALLRLWMPVVVERYNRALIDAVKSRSPAAFLTVKGAYIFPSTLKIITDNGIPCVNYYPDVVFSHKSVNQSSLLNYSLFVTTKSFQVAYLAQRLGDNRVKFLHHGYVEDVFKPPLTVGRRDYHYDLIYIGNHSVDKERWLKRISDKFPGISMMIYGYRWKENVTTGSLSSRIAGRAVSGDELLNAVYGAKINLAIHWGALDDTGWYDRVSTRTFEIPACKGFMLHIDNDEVRELFDPENEIGVFKDESELFQKIDFYLANDKLREEMVEKAYQRCVPAYSYDERAKVIAGWLEEMRVS